MPDSVDPAKNSDFLNHEALRSLNFGPAWASGKAEQPKQPARAEQFGERESHRDRAPADRRDRRGFDRPRRETSPTNNDLGVAPTSPSREGREPFGNRERHDSRDSRPPRRTEGGRPEFRRDGGAPRRDDRGPRDRDGDNRARGPRPQGRRDDAPRREQFRPIVKVDIYPEEKPFGAMLKAVKASCRTFELFEIAKTILEKNERFVVSVRPLDAEKNPEARLYQSLADQQVFLTEQEALAHALKLAVDNGFTAEIVEVEAPKGTFTGIARCGFTGEFLAPTNYHGYQKTLRDHFAAKIGDAAMSFERFASRVETVKDDAALAAWLESKTKQTRYTAKTTGEETPATFDSLEAVHAHVLATNKDALVKAVAFARFPGKILDTFLPGPIRSSIEHEVAFQRKFPLDTANSIRGRIRKAGFSLYKRGAKGVTYICGVKRKFRTQATPPFSDEIKRVFDLIETTQSAGPESFLHLSDLPEKLLGIKPAAKAEPTAEGETPAAPSHTPEEVAALSSLSQNVRWLVTEGYVTEFSDGRLFALPVMSEAQAKAAAAEEDNRGKPTSAEDASTDAESPVA